MNLPYFLAQAQGETATSDEPSPKLFDQAEQSFIAVEQLMEEALSFVVAYGFQILGAVILLSLGIWIAQKLSDIVLKICEGRKFDITLSRFLASVVRITTLVFVFVIVLNQFGITITPFIAAIGAGAFGISLAIQGPISNIGAGLSLIVSRPFKVGETLTIHDRSGIVEDIKLAWTIIKTEDGELITIPNRQVVGEIYENTFQSKLYEGIIGIPYGQDPREAIDIIQTAISGIDLVMKDPPPQVGIHEFADSSINIGYRTWVPTLQYHEIRYKINLTVFESLKASQIEVPFPQREVRLLNEK